MRISRWSSVGMGSRVEAVWLCLMTMSFLMEMGMVMGARIKCATTNQCSKHVMKRSECIDGFCTNAFSNGGCLINMKPGWDQLRVCNSEDNVLSSSEQQKQCRPADPHLNYMEIRILTQNWESSFFESWVLQILLSEILGVPATIETGTPTDTINYYDPNGGFKYGKGNDFNALRTAKKVKDCRVLRHNQNQINSSSTTTTHQYQSCAHVLVELWTDSHTQTIRQLEEDKIVEPTMTLGALGIQTWHIPKFTAMRDPTLLSYFGMTGEQNRRKLADMFLRPTTWGDYCTQVSSNNCQTPDTVATRAPIDSSEQTKMFVEGLYTGHFRKTEKNDCDRHPTNCTGHIADYPCGWTSFIKQQTSHLNIALQSDGTQAAAGYTHSQLLEMWAAANATKSNIIGLWWTPEILYSRFKNTDAELLPVTLPLPTQQCIQSRVSMDARCSANISAQIGDPAGACDDSPQILQKLISTTLVESINDADIALTRRSPALDTIKRFKITQYQVGQFFEYWLAIGKDRHSHDPREAACQWFVENFDYIIDEFVPKGYPRVFQEDKNKGASLFIISLSVACLSALFVLGATCTTFLQRQKPIISLSQIEFLFIVLAGLLLVSIGAIIQAVPPTNVSCVLSVWLIYLGSTMELVPLIVKVAAINRIMHAAKKMKRVVLNRRNLFGAVALLNFIMFLFLIVWTSLDTPRQDSEDVLSDTVTAMGEKIIYLNPYCNGGFVGWIYAALAWNVILLLTATVLAYQARNHREEFNESASLATMIYSHFVFLVLRLITYLLENFNGWKQADLAWIRSLIFSLDVIATLSIYFVPKFMRKEKPKQGNFGFRQTAEPCLSSILNMEAAMSRESLAAAGLDDSTFPHTRCASLTFSQSVMQNYEKELLQSDSQPCRCQMDEERSSTQIALGVSSDKPSRLGDCDPLKSLQPPAKAIPQVDGPDQISQ